MSTKFFNNTGNNTLFEKLKGIAAEMATFDRFLAVVGYFRSSGYFKLRKELGDISDIRILVGINVDNIFRDNDLGWQMIEAPKKAKELYNDQFRQDVIDAEYSKEVEEGILQLCEDLAAGRLQLKIHPTKNLHAKFYLCLPKDHTPNSDGWVIMGSSNISDYGLGIGTAPRYELNVALRDYDDVHFCHEEFETLWNEAIPLTANEVDKFKSETYLGYQPTPYEIYMKVLIEVFGDQVEDDFTLQLPEGVMDLKYQTDAVIQGYQMLMKHNGLFLADVVGLGKTYIATMIAKRFIEANGKNTRILIVYPPALETTWREACEKFGIAKRYVHYVTNGSLSKVLKEDKNYPPKEDFDLVIVDEAHGFRNDVATRYDELQKICKSDCNNRGLLNLSRKKVMLLSATPLNNRPEDFLNLLSLFQDAGRSTIDGITNLNTFFTPYNARYKKLMSNRGDADVRTEVEQIYNDIRNKVLDKVTIRRTRNNILNDPDYCEDLKKQGVVFPDIKPPIALEYKLSANLQYHFFSTLTILADEKAPIHLFYARYRAIEFLKEDIRKKYPNAEQYARSLAGIYRVHMVKRLESSFFAFKRSLATLLRITEDMITMFENDKVIIAPDINIKDKLFKGWTLDEIIEYACKNGYDKNDVCYKAEDFQDGFLEMLENDRQVLRTLCDNWNKIDEDPKLDTFINSLGSFTDKTTNTTGKLVVFSESVDTVNYLYDYLTNTLKRKDVLKVDAASREKLAATIRHNFDANEKPDSQRNDYNILISSDVLAEGVNLHRSNVIVNYDTPWNSTRLMQRIGRVNRIGSTADAIYNYMFYPSQQGDEQIQLYKNALLKLQGFHSALGEDSQIYSVEEIVKEFELYDPNVRDVVDKKIALLRQLRELYNTDNKWYHKIKALPLKSRVFRKVGKHLGHSIVFVSSPVKTEFYHIEGNKEPKALDFLDAVKYIEASRDEKPVHFAGDEKHYEQITAAVRKFQSDVSETTKSDSIVTANLDKNAQKAVVFLKRIMQNCNDDQVLKQNCEKLQKCVSQGVYRKLPVRLNAIAKEYDQPGKIKENAYKLQSQIGSLVSEYYNEISNEDNPTEVGKPAIIISESFL